MMNLWLLINCVCQLSDPILLDYPSGEQIFWGASVIFTPYSLRCVRIFFLWKSFRCIFTTLTLLIDYRINVALDAIIYCRTTSILYFSLCDCFLICLLTLVLGVYSSRHLGSQFFLFLFIYKIFVVFKGIMGCVKWICTSKYAIQDQKKFSSCTCPPTLCSALTQTSWAFQNFVFHGGETITKSKKKCTWGVPCFSGVIWAMQCLFLAGLGGSRSCLILLVCISLQSDTHKEHLKKFVLGTLTCVILFLHYCHYSISYGLGIGWMG